MIDPYKALRRLSKVFLVFAWLSLAWGLMALFSAQIADVTHYNYDLDMMITDKAGIGVLGVLTIVIETAWRFLLLMGASQAIKLLLALSESLERLEFKLIEIMTATTDLKAGIVKTSEDVRKVGSLVYEEAQKAD